MKKKEMSFDSDKWREFQDEALKSLTFDADVNSIFIIKIINSFSPSIIWRVVKTSSREKEENSFAEFRRWRSDIDQEKFRSPVELLKHIGSLKPTIETGRFAISNEFCKESLSRFYSIKIPPIIELETFGLDGSTTEIQFGGIFLNSKFSWWNNPPEKWKELGEIVTNILNKLNSKISV